jgi:CheY-like chemotaxis protein
MQYRASVQEGFPVPLLEPVLGGSVIAADVKNHPCYGLAMARGQAGCGAIFAHANGITLTLHRAALFATLKLGHSKNIGLGARNSTMTVSRPPGGSVFLVEDEVMIRMMVADMLDELGYRVAAEAGEINEAIKLAQSTEFDIAILDVNVNGKVISPVAELIKARNRPFIFATGYGSQGLPEEYRDRPALQKPFQIETLGKMIEGALRNATA